MFRSLSGRFLILTIVFVMLAEVLIFVPSIARFRQDYLQNRLERAQIASLALEVDAMISPELEVELLENSGVYNVVLNRNEARQLMLSSSIPSPVIATYDLRDPGPFELIRDAFKCLLETEDRVIRVVGEPVKDAGLLIEVTLPTDPMRAAMLDYGQRVLFLSLAISIITAGLLFMVVRGMMVQPIRRVVGHMQSYAEAPEDARRVIEPQSNILEIHEAEAAFKSMQTQLTGSLKQKDHLAQLGGAVAKISHDLRNILTSAQLFTDRIETSEDPTVKRLAPKLVRSITRAVNLCETTLAYGRAEEPAPTLETFALGPLVDDVVESEDLAKAREDISLSAVVPDGFMINADKDQMNRVLTNLTRNARQALEARGQAGNVTITARENDQSWILGVMDDGSGMPQTAVDNLFTAFQGNTTRGGSGLGLAISAELIRGHGGALVLESTGDVGTAFAITIPKS